MRLCFGARNRNSLEYMGGKRLQLLDDNDCGGVEN